MKPYDPNHDYCGPEGKWISRLIPRRIWGVDINCCCFDHDNDYLDIDISQKAADKLFHECIKNRLRIAYGKYDPRRYFGFVRARLYFTVVTVRGGKYAK